MQNPNPQRFTTSFTESSPFTSRGLRSFWEYRDLGVAEGSAGQVRATVLRAVQPCPPGGTGWHYHELAFQMYYVLKGTLRTQVEGEGELDFKAGDSFLQPPRTRHCVLHFSDDLELLEIISPADFGTVEVDVPE
jgi:mannose-6-phosphate isomerase-like protein (cupin superfamily)